MSILKLDPGAFSVIGRLRLVGNLISASLLLENDPFDLELIDVLRIRQNVCCLCFHSRMLWVAPRFWRRSVKSRIIEQPETNARKLRLQLGTGTVLLK